MIVIEDREKKKLLLDLNQELLFALKNSILLRFLHKVVNKI